MTQFICGHREHTGDRPNLTIEVVSALRTPRTVVGDPDRGDDAVTRAALETSTPDPQSAYVGTSPGGGPYIELAEPSLEPAPWPANLFDWLIISLAVAATGWLVIVLGVDPGIVAAVGAIIAFLLIAAWGNSLRSPGAASDVTAARPGRAPGTAARSDAQRGAAKAHMWRVVVPCPKKVANSHHTVVFDRPAGALDTWPAHVFGTVASSGDTARTSAYAPYADPDKAADRINAQATAVIAGQALFVLFLGGVVWRVTTTNGAATGVDQIDELVRDQPAAFSLAIAALAVSFAMAVLGQRTGFVGAVNLRDHAGAAAAFNRSLRWRSALVHNAAVMLAVSLLLAVAVPIAAATTRQPAVAIDAPSWQLNDGVWTATSTLHLTGLRGSQRLDAAAWLDDGEHTARLLQRWRGVAPAPDGASVDVAVETAAAPPAELVIGVDVPDVEEPSGGRADHVDGCGEWLACGRFAVPDAPADTAPDIELTNTSGPVAGSVPIPAAPSQDPLRVIIWTIGRGGGSEIAFQAVAGPVAATDRTLPFSIAATDDVAEVVIDATFIDGESEDPDPARCQRSPVAPGCVVVRLE